MDVNGPHLLGKNNKKNTKFGKKGVDQG